MKPSRGISLVALGLLVGLLIGLPVGWHFGLRNLKVRREQVIENLRIMTLASKMYGLAYSNNPAAVAELITNSPFKKP